MLVSDVSWMFSLFVYSLSSKYFLYVFDYASVNLLCINEGTLIVLTNEFENDESYVNFKTHLYDLV